MSQYRAGLPQLTDRVFLTDGGIETSLIFHDGLELPEFAAFVLLRDEGGTEALRRYFTPYLEIARNARTGIVLESATWRANPDWAATLGYSTEELEAANRAAMDLLVQLRETYQSADTPVVLSGCVGPRGDGKGEEWKACYHDLRATVFVADWIRSRKTLKPAPSPTSAPAH